MKNNIKITIIVLLVLCAHHSTYAYRWILNNFTSKLILVQVELLESKRPFFVLVSPKQSADFDWSPGNTMAGFCLGKLKYLIPDDYLLKQNGLINRSTMEVRDSGKLLAWLDNYSIPEKAKAIGLSKPYVRQEADLLLVADELYDETVEHAKKLTGTSFGAKIVGHFADLVKESKCRGRDIMIVEKNGKIEFYTFAN
jgi:hypothetical protein